MAYASSPFNTPGCNLTEGYISESDPAGIVNVISNLKEKFDLACQNYDMVTQNSDFLSFLTFKLLCVLFLAGMGFYIIYYK